MFFMKKNKQKGFTLVELLAVIVILAILATAAYTLIIPKINENKPKTFVSDVSSLVAAYDAYAQFETPKEGSISLYTSSSSSTKVACTYATVEELISSGNIKITGNDKAKGIVALCNRQYYVSYTNGRYMTSYSIGSTSGSLVDNRIISFSEDGTINNFKECSTDCTALTSIASKDSSSPTITKGY